MTLNVPSIKCEGCAETIVKAIKGQDGQADVTVDVATKVVEVTSGRLSESSVKQAIVAAGHQVA
ncbi:MAG: heavy-metal-associated domain-containing protein [Cyanobacteria bacterium J06598_3]